MPEIESCLYPAHDLAPYRATVDILWSSTPLGTTEAALTTDGVGEQIDELISEVERLRAGLNWGLSALHDDPDAPRTYERMAELAYEMASRIEALLPPTPAQIAEELDLAQQADAHSY